MATPVRPTSPQRQRVVGVEPELGRQVERDREARLAAVEQEAEPLVRLLGRREAGVLAHRPRPAAVALGPDAARERELARRRAHGRGVVGAVDRLRHRRNDRARAEAGPPRAGTLPGVRITVRLFAALRERAGWSERELDVPDGAAVADVWPRLELGDEPPGLAYARNREYAGRGDDARRRRRGRGHPAGLGRRVPRPGRAARPRRGRGRGRRPGRRRDRDVHRHHPRSTAADAP